VDLAIIDILLTDVSGIEVLRHIKERDKEMPIIMISALNKAGPAVTSMQLGACDYITKPFDNKELSDKVEKALTKADYRKAHKHELIKDDELVVDLTQRLVLVSDEPVSLTNKEYNLLHLLLRHSGKLLSRDSIVDEIWGNEFEFGSRTLDAHICSLRKKLKRQGGRIVTVSGEGYKYNGN
jgi:DNA-binding response OmpR family regulator